MTDDPLLSASWDELVDALDGQPDDVVDETLRHRMRWDRAAFARVCFPAQVYGAPSAFHLDVLARPAVGYQDQRGERRRIDLAHRGAAKSTFISRLDVVHAVVYGLERFIAIASCTDDLSSVFVKTLWNIFKYPAAHPTFHAMYGPFELRGGMTDFVVAAPGMASVRIGAFSVKGNIRGEIHEGQRPTRIVYDDMEHARLSASPAERDAAWRWIVSDAGEAGDPTCCVHDFVGTPTHRDGPVMRALASPAWQARKWPALQAWPTRMDLWEQCRALWADLVDYNRIETARAFYEAHREEMDAGSAVLWPERYPLFELMCRWWANAKSFAAEMQMDPRDPSAQVFDSTSFRRCRWDGAEHVETSRGRRVSLRDCDIAVWLDPIPPSAAGKDSAALAVAARERSTGQRFVLSCRLGRWTPSAQRAAMWAAFERWGSRARYGYESNVFASLFDDDFRREREQRKAEGKPHNMDVRGHASTENKVERITSMEPATVNGWVEFDVGLSPEVLGQFDDLPNGAHDDGADAIERADWLLTAGAVPGANAW